MKCKHRLPSARFFFSALFALTCSLPYISLAYDGNEVPPERIEVTGSFSFGVGGAPTQDINCIGTAVEVVNDCVEQTVNDYLVAIDRDENIFDRAEWERNNLWRSGAMPPICFIHTPSGNSGCLVGTFYEGTVVPICPSGYTADKITVKPSPDPSTWIFTGIRTCIAPPDRFVDDYNRGDENCPALVGDPIHVGSGNSVQREVDYREGGLEIVRVHNSKPARTQLDNQDRGFGPQWMLTYHRRLVTEDLVRVLETDASSSWSFQRIQIIRGDGGISYARNRMNADFTDTIDEYWDVRDGTGVELRSLTTGGVLSGFELIGPDGLIEQYNVQGQLVSFSQPGAPGVSLFYDGEGRLATVQHFTGRTLTLNYAPDSDRIDSITNPAGESIAYIYAPDNKLERVDRPGGAFRAYEYTVSGSTGTPLSRITDNLGVVAEWEYGFANRAESSQFAGGIGRVEIDYGPLNGTVRTVTNPLGKETVYDMEVVAGESNVGTVDGVATALCAATTQSSQYDALGYRSGYVDRNGNTSTEIRNERGLIEQLTEAVGTSDERTTTTTWHPSYRLPVNVIRPGQTDTFAYNAAGQLLSQTRTDTQTQTVPYTTTGRTRVWTYTYHANGLVETVDGPRTDVTDVTTYTYDANNDVATIQNALGHTTTILSRDGRGLPLQIEDPNGTITEMVYDLRGNLTSTSVLHPSGDATTQFVYDLADQLVQIVRPNGVTLDYEYDNARRLVAVENNLGERIEYTLDNAGNITTTNIRDAGSAIVSAQSQIFDELSRLRNEIGANGQNYAYSYDANDNLVQQSDDLARTTGRSIDALDRLITLTNPSLDNSGTTYDARGNVLTKTDFGGVTTTYIYDGLDNLIQESSPDMGTTIHVYDDAGNRTQSTDGRGVVKQHSYDALNRLLTTTYPASVTENVSYVYDQGVLGIGRLSSMSDESGTTTYTYDHRGNRLTLSRVDGLITLDQAWTYDLADNVETMSYPSGRIVTYVRDGLGRVSSMTSQLPGEAIETLVSNVTYAPFGPALTWTSGNGVTNTRTLDLDYRMDSVTIAGTVGTLHQLTYGYDTVDNIGSVLDGVNATLDQTFSYDLEDRLETAVSHYGDQTYVYDANGNRTQRTRIVDDGAGGLTTKTQNLTYATGTNRLELRGTKQVLQDGAGNRTSDKDGAKLLSYNHANRQNTWTQDGLLEATYVYNGQGQRTKKTRFKDTGNKNQHFYYDSNGQLLGNLTQKIGGGTAFFDYIWLDDVPLVRIKRNYNVSGVFTTAKTTWLHADHLNTPRIGTDDTQTIVWRWDSDPFGLGGIDSDPDGDGTKHSIPLRFPGQYKDGESGLTYNYFRTYDGSVGRYTQADPIGLLGGLNRFSYAELNPLGKIDPTGENAVGLIILGGVTAIGLYAYYDCIDTCHEQEECRNDDSPGQNLNECIDRCSPFIEFFDTPLDLEHAAAEAAEAIGEFIGEQLLD